MENHELTGDLQAPVIIVGAGRSGTTLLVRALNAHPLVCFRGETGFLVARIWREVYENRFWYNWQRFVSTHPSSSAQALPPDETGELVALEAEVGKAIPHFVFQLFKINPSAIRWGFKEIWNGSSSFNYDWQIYRAIFRACKLDSRGPKSVCICPVVRPMEPSTSR